MDDEFLKSNKFRGKGEGGRVLKGSPLPLASVGLCAYLLDFFEEK
jgi:hypothetical protein